MKKLSKLKLNDWAETQLSNSELRELRGGGEGTTCYAGCAPGEDSAALAEQDKEERTPPPVLTLPPAEIPNTKPGFPHLLP